MFETVSQADLLAARWQMALSLGWHIVIACFGVGFPAMILMAEWLGHRRRDPDFTALARRWARAAGVLFAIGAVSGTILSFEMGILWPGLMGVFGEVIGLPFALEGIAFFIEAIFLGIYLYGWDRHSPVAGLLTLPQVVVGDWAARFLAEYQHAAIQASAVASVTPSNVKRRRVPARCAAPRRFGGRTARHRVPPDAFAVSVRSAPSDVVDGFVDGAARQVEIEDRLVHGVDFERRGADDEGPRRRALRPRRRRWAPARRRRLSSDAPADALEGRRRWTSVYELSGQHPPRSIGLLG